jgi:hypothetical protein
MRQAVESIPCIANDIASFITNQMLGVNPNLDDLRYKAEQRMEDLASVIREIRHLGIPIPHANSNPKPDEWRHRFGVALEKLEKACRDHIEKTAELAAKVPRFQPGMKDVQQREEKRREALDTWVRTKKTIDELRQKLFSLSQHIDWQATESVPAPAAKTRSEPSRGQAASAEETSPPRAALSGTPPRSAAPRPQDMRVLSFMVCWEHELRSGVSPYGQPEHYLLPEQGDTENDRAALKLLRACCTNYWDAEKTILPFVNASSSFQRPILERMKAIVEAARQAAAKAALFDGPSAAGGEAPEGGGATDPSSPELPPGTSAIPACPGCGSPPAAEDVDDVCPHCRAYQFRCGIATHIPLGDASHTKQQVVRPYWERLPPSQVREPAPGWPLVGERTGRRESLPELGRDPNRDRQSRHCQGFDPDWFMPPLLAAKWQSHWYPREATRESVEQWVKRIDQIRVEYLGPLGIPERAAELEAEKENDLALIREHAPQLLEAVRVPPPGPVHNADFTMVNWFATEYHFALGIQASAVKALWEEWERSGLGLHQETIRDAVDAERDNFRMDNAFRNHPAFGTMIQRCGDGRYKLAPPGAQPPPSTPKDKRNAKNAPKSRRKRV